MQKDWNGNADENVDDDDDDDDGNICFVQDQHAQMHFMVLAHRNNSS